MCQPGNTQNGGTVLPIARLAVDAESGSPDSYSSFLVTICLSRLVSEIFACDRQTDGQGRTITIAGPQTVAGQLIHYTGHNTSHHNKYKSIKNHNLALPTSQLNRSKGTIVITY